MSVKDETLETVLEHKRRWIPSMLDGLISEGTSDFGRRERRMLELAVLKEVVYWPEMLDANETFARELAKKLPLADIARDLLAHIDPHHTAPFLSKLIRGHGDLRAFIQTTLLLPTAGAFHVLRSAGLLEKERTAGDVKGNGAREEGYTFRILPIADGLSRMRVLVVRGKEKEKRPEPVTLLTATGEDHVSRAGAVTVRAASHGPSVKLSEEAPDLKLIMQGWSQMVTENAALGAIASEQSLFFLHRVEQTLYMSRTYHMQTDPVLLSFFTFVGCVCGTFPLPTIPLSLVPTLTSAAPSTPSVASNSRGNEDPPRAREN